MPKVTDPTSGKAKAPKTSRKSADNEGDEGKKSFKLY